MLTKTLSSIKPVPKNPKPLAKKRLAVESLESRLNLSGLAGLSSAVQELQISRLSSPAQTSTLQTVKPLTVTLGASSADSALFGDTTVNSGGTTTVPITDYSAISNARIEYNYGGVNIGYMATSGVTIDYKLNVAAAGTYNLTFGLANLNYATFDLAVNGSKAAGYGFNGTGNWGSFTPVTQQVTLAAGSNTLRITPTWGSQFNINSISLSPANPGSTASTTTSATNNVGSSAVITADKYSDISNSKVEWTNGNSDIGYVSTNGAYVEYTLNVQSAGNYKIDVDTSTTQSYAGYNLTVNGGSAVGYGTGSTGSWANYTRLSNTVALNAGANKIRFSSLWGTQYNIGTIYVTSTSAATTTTSTTTNNSVVTPPAPTPTPAPAPVVAPNSGGNVAIGSAWMSSFNQLNVTGSSGADSIYVSQSGDTLTINANGKTSTYSASSYGTLYIKGGDGNDTITIDSSVRIDAQIFGEGGNDTLTNKTQGKGTIVAIGGGYDTLTGGGWNTSYWADSSDGITASGGESNGGYVHKVSGFWGGVSTELWGQNLNDPAGTGATTRLTSSSLWGKGPTMDDVTQGQVADCYLLGALQTMANTVPDRLRELAVDLGDGTYAIQFKSGGSSVFVRVDGDLPSNGYYANGINYAHPGSSGAQWMPIIEKAYAEYRGNAWNYSNLGWGSFMAVYSDFGVSYNGTYGDANTLFNNIQGAVNNNKGVTIGTLATINSGAPLIGNHTYTVTKAWRDGSGTGYFTLRNPWGYDGAGNDGNNDGYVTLSMYQLQSNFVAGSILV